MCSEKKYQSFSELDGSVFGCQTSPHNHYLQILTETGIVGMTFFLILIFSFLNYFYLKINVFNNKYGTLASSTKDLLNKNFDVLFDIDWQGTQQLSQNNNNILTIFILPPDKNEIERRLKKRETENSENIDIVHERMSKFEDELSHWKEYNYVVTNDNFDECVSEILTIITAERKKKTRKKIIFDKIRNITNKIKYFLLFRNNL